MTTGVQSRGLALIGLRGTGKSTVGRILAQRLGLPFADADAELETRVGRSIRELFNDEGEPVFRAGSRNSVASSGSPPRPPSSPLVWRPTRAAWPDALP